MPEQNEKNLPKAPAFNPKVKETIAAFKENNNPKNLNDILNAAGTLAAAGPRRV